MRSRHLRTGLAATAAASAAVSTLAALPASASAPPRAHSAPAATSARSAARGAVVSDERIERLSRAATARRLDDLGFRGTRPRYGVDVHRVVYRTVTGRGAPTTASGLVVLPRGGPHRLRAVQYGHGTMAFRGDTGTMDPTSRDRGAAAMFAGAGFAGVAPDYLGLGLGPGRHPYMDVATETSASVDMLRAARAVVARGRRALDRRVFVTGFSQGGHAAMALGRALRNGADPDLELAALAPVSGPYELGRAQIPDSLDGTSLDPKEVNFYFGYWLTAANRTNRFYRDPSEVFRAPYDRIVPRLFDGKHQEAEIFKSLPDGPSDMLTPRAIEWMRHPSGALLRAVRAGDGVCEGWAPKAPVRLYTARADRDVTTRNAALCRESLRARGVDAPIVDLGDLDHMASGVAAMPDVLRWFQSVR